MIIPTKEFLDIFKATEGALGVSESIAIMNIASEVVEGLAVELGTYKGKSAMSAAFRLKDMTQFYLVEPEFKNSGWFEEVYKNINSAIYNTPRNILIKPFTEYSIDVIPYFKNISFCFVDSGSHGDGLPMKEVMLLEDRMVEDGIIAFHDYLSQFVEVEQAYNYLLGTGKYEEIKINWDEINTYVNENNLEEGNKSWHHNELKNPNFVGALKRK